MNYYSEPPMKARDQYTLAWRATRMFSDVSIMSKWLKSQGVYQPYIAYALRSATYRNWSQRWTVKAYNDIWCKKHRYSSGLLWAMAAYENVTPIMQSYNENWR
jgi:hypothetical protein